MAFPSTPDDWVSWLTDPDEEKREEAVSILGNLQPDDTVSRWSAIATRNIRLKQTRSVSNPDASD